MNDYSGQPRALASKRPSYWPRRLLHISSLHSHERGGGNCYGDIREPRYATISYTWGRFEVPHGDALSVTGIPWKIPAINEEHFTVQNFAKTIRAIGTICNVEFVWLDVACVNMTDGSDLDAEEISMQRDIFRGASQSFIWLSETTSQSLSTILGSMAALLDLGMDRTKNLGEEESYPSKLPEQAIPVFERLLADPWFKSLWTLQEAMANPNAILLSADGSPIPLAHGWSCFSHGESQVLLKENDDTGPPRVLRTRELFPGEHDGETGPLRTTYVTLHHLVCMSQSVRDLISSLPHQLVASALSDLIRRIEESGLSSFTSFNLLHLWKVAQSRNATSADDRLEYFHRHVLRFPCGFNTPFAAKDSIFSDRYAFFNSHFLYHFPVLGQLFTRTRFDNASNSWHIGPDCCFPELDLLFTCFQGYEPLINTKDIGSDGAPRVAFTGQMFPFRQTLDRLLDRSSQSAELLGISFDCSYARFSDRAIYIPAMSALPTRRLDTAFQGQTWFIPSRDGIQHVKTFRTLISGTEHEVRLLLLANAAGHERLAPGLAIAAVVMSDEKSKEWRRLGWCFWVYNEPEHDDQETNFRGVDRQHFGLVNIDGVMVEGIYV